MRVALFIDGKSFYSGMIDAIGRQPLDFSKLARWMVERIGGSLFWGAYYYTGIETGQASETERQVGLFKFLDWLERQPGYFVYRFPRRPRRMTCPHCEAEVQYTEEKKVDTTMVADMLRLAAVGAFDAIVLVGGDADFAPAVEGVRALGKQAYVASWGEIGLSSRLRRVAFDHVDLREGLAAFTKVLPVVPPSADVGAPRESNEAGEANSVGEVERRDSSPGETDRISSPPEGRERPLPDLMREYDLFLEELQGAEATLPFVGVKYFLSRWKSSLLDLSLSLRHKILDDLVARGDVEIFDHEGTKAIKVRR